MIIIEDIRNLRCGLDTKTEDIKLEYLRYGLKEIARAHFIAVVNGNQIIILKDRSGLPIGRIYNINLLPEIILNRLIEKDHINIKNIIFYLSKYNINSSECLDLSRHFERLSFEKS